MTRERLHRQIWNALQREMDVRKPCWREKVGEISVDHQRKRREAGGSFDDSEVFEALLLAALSSQTDWSKIQAIRHRLRNAVLNFDVDAFANLNETTGIYTALKLDGAGSQNLRRMLGYLQETIRVLISHATAYGSIDGYFADQFNLVGRSPDQLALALGLPGPRKLRGFGVALAAEALRNLGYNLAKPDRHVLRAVGVWGLVEFPNWNRDKKPVPSANPSKLLETMQAIRGFADDIGESVSLTDTTIWYACSKGGGRLTNAELAMFAA